ncbi:hypothetical protein ACF0H5_002367 [Mactra antiquata]
MGNCCGRNMFEFLDEYEGLVNQLDESSVSLCKSIDNINATIEFILQHVESLKGHLGVDNEKYKAGQDRLWYLVSYLLKTINDSVVSNKTTMVKQQKQLLRYIAEVFNEKLKSSEEVNSSFALEKYDASLQFRHRDFNDFVSAHDDCRKRENHLQAELCKIQNEVEKLQKSENACKSDIDRLQDENNVLRMENKKLEQETKLKESRTKQIEKLQQQMNQEQRRAVETAEKKDKEIRDLQQQLQNQKSDYEKMVKRNLELKDTNEQIKKQITISETKSTEREDTLSQELDTVKTSNDKLLKTLSDLQQELQSERESSNARISSLTEDNNRLNDELREQMGDKNECMKQKEILQKKMDDLQNIETQNKQVIDQLQQEIATLLSKVEEHKSLASHKNKELESKMGEIESLMSRTEKLTGEITLLKSKQVINVQILFKQRTAWADSIEDILMTLMKSKINSDTLELKFRQCVSSDDVKLGSPVLVICVVVSRIGTDATKGTQGLTMTENTALICVHHKDAHALPDQSSDRILQSPEYKQCGGIYDIGYQRDKGIYECGMNAKTIISLTNFIKECGVPEPMFGNI